MALEDVRGLPCVEQGRQSAIDRVVVVGAAVQGLFTGLEPLQDGAVRFQLLLCFFDLDILGIAIRPEGPGFQEIGFVNGRSHLLPPFTAAADHGVKGRSHLSVLIRRHGVRGQAGGRRLAKGRGLEQAARVIGLQPV